MKLSLLSTLSLVCVFSCHASGPVCHISEKPTQTQAQPRMQQPAQASKVADDYDCGPDLLKIFTKELIPGFTDMALGNSANNPHQEAAGMSQFAKGVLAFASLIVSEATRHHKGLDEEAVAQLIKDVIATEKVKGMLAALNRHPQRSE